MLPVLAQAGPVGGLSGQQANVAVLAVGGAALWALYESTRSGTRSRAMLLAVVGVALGGAAGWLAASDVPTATLAASAFLLLAGLGNLFGASRPGETGAWLVLAVVGVVALGVASSYEVAAFVGFGSLVLFGAIKVITVDELVHATLWLALVLFGVAGLFLVLGAMFLALVQVLVYVGAVITLILFTVMLTVPRKEEVVLDGLDLPVGVTIERVEDLDPETPRYGQGPMKSFGDTNPRKPSVPPASLYGVALEDDVFGTDATTRRKAGEKKEGA